MYFFIENNSASKGHCFLHYFQSSASIEPDGPFFCSKKFNVHSGNFLMFISISKLSFCEVCDKFVCFIGRLLGLRTTTDCGAFIYPVDIITVAAPDAPLFRPLLPLEVCQNPCPASGLNILNHALHPLIAMWASTSYR